MLDALVAEASARFGLDLRAGLQVVAAEQLIATPIEASRPLLVVPLADLGATAASAPSAEPLAGRNGTLGGDAFAVLRRLYTADATVGRLGDPTADATTVGDLETSDFGRPLYLPPIAPELAAAGPWSMPYI